MKYLIIALCLVFSYISPSFAQDYQPNVSSSKKIISNRVIDEDTLLNIKQTNTIILAIRNFEKTSTDNPQLAVMFKKSDVEDIKTFTNEKFKKLGIGDKKKNNGILIAITPSKIRIEIGYGLEGVLPDSVVNDILYDNKKLFEDKKYDELIPNILVKLREKIGKAEVSQETSSEAPIWFYCFIVVILFIICGLIFGFENVIEIFFWILLAILSGGKSSDGGFSGGSSGGGGSD